MRIPIGLGTLNPASGFVFYPQLRRKRHAKDDIDLHNDTAIADQMAYAPSTGLDESEIDRKYVDFLAKEKARWEIANSRRERRQLLDNWLRKAKGMVFDCLVKATRYEDRKIGDNIERVPVVDAFMLVDQLAKHGFDISRYDPMFNDKSPREQQVARRVWSQVRGFAKYIGTSEPVKFPDFDLTSPYQVQAMVCRMANDVGFGYDLARIAAVNASIGDQYNALKARLSFLTR